jgi:glycosyltransferase involved in cell wall biosynthesis
VHVCFFNRSYWPDFGATGQLLTELAEDLVRVHGWQVTVVSGYPLRVEHQPPARERRNGVDIVRATGTTADPRRFAGRAANYVSYFASAAIAAFQLARPDVIVAMTDPPIIGLAAVAAARSHRVPFVFLCEDLFPEAGALVEDFHSPTVNRTLLAINRFLVRRAARVVAIGETMERRLIDDKGADPARLAVIHNWADCAAVQPGPRDNPFARAHGLVEPFVVLHAGNIGLGQELDAVLDAAVRLSDRSDIVFLFVGDGARRAALEARAARQQLANVRFVPYQPRETMSQSYATADVAVVSLRKGLAGVIVPSKLYTVLASGRACLAAVEDACEVATVVRQADCGVVVAPGDGAAIAAEVSRLAADRAAVAAMGERARAAAMQFDRPRQVAAYARLLAGVASC